MIEFRNEPWLELRRAAERARLTDALDEVRRRLPIAVPVIVDGRRRDGEDVISLDPSRPERVVGRAAQATAADVRDAALVDDPGIHTIVFTGSGAVGLAILARAARPPAGQAHLKRVVAEMGGKNCMIVDADADLDDVVPAALQSAFGFAGQKCSATSRLLVHERVAMTLTERLAGALQTMLVGPAWDFQTDVPPVIEQAARDRIEATVAAAGDAAKRVVRAAPPASPGGYAVAPTLVLEPDRDAPVCRDEIFGPVLTVEPVASVHDACELFAGQRQALTGGLFSRDPRTIAEVARRTPVGNLYVNRITTGAMVGRQPFGGNRLSGTGTKAGGPDYLLQFVEPVVICEDTTRHGIAT